MFLEYLTQFQLPLKKKIKKFSRGMKMKLEFAIAFSHGATAAFEKENQKVFSRNENETGVCDCL